jgi:hypothetical protein
MEYLKTNDTVGIKTLKNNNIIQIEFDKNNIIIISINKSKLVINKDYINNNITPNFTVEMLYYILYELIKYNNYNLIEDNNSYIFEGCYHEPYEQGDEIYIKIYIK